MLLEGAQSVRPSIVDVIPTRIGDRGHDERSGDRNGHGGYPCLIDESLGKGGRTNDQSELTEGGQRQGSMQRGARPQAEACEEPEEAERLAGKQEDDRESNPPRCGRRCAAQSNR